MTPNPTKPIAPRLTEWDARESLRVLDRLMCAELSALRNALADALDRPGGKLSDADVEMMCRLHDEYGLGYKRLAEKFDCPVSTARNICRGTTRGVPRNPSNIH